MKFNINDYPGACAMHCPHYSDAVVFTKYLYSSGRTWNSGQSYEEKICNFDVYPPEGVYYYFNEGLHGRVESLSSKRRVLNFDDFEWENDLSPTHEEITLISSFISEFRIN